MNDSNPFPVGSSGVASPTDAFNLTPLGRPVKRFDGLYSKGYNVLAGGSPSSLLPALGPFGAPFLIPRDKFRLKAVLIGFPLLPIVLGDLLLIRHAHPIDLVTLLHEALHMAFAQILKEPIGEI